MKSKSRIVFEDQYGSRVEREVDAGSTVLEIAVENSVDISHSCGGMGTCGTCRIHLSVLSGQPLARNEIEQEMATDRGFQTDERLSCQVECPKTQFEWLVRFTSAE
ncbi:MAG: (2Fe-2S)-binding protein [Bdellovibrionaceae bacterium]|nr:(2Fe-2S)-binding protein [Pseudobdellovibrionaceae bacterium]